MKELKYLWTVIVGLAMWVKVLLYLLFSAAIVAIAGYFGLRAAIIAAIVLVLLGLLLIFFSVLANWVRERKAAELRGELDDSSAARGYMDANMAARLDALRDAFGKGLEKFHSTGKDIYEVPWFLLIGESRSGKSSAIRNSRIELPKGLQDIEQGKHGTQCLDWWYTNYAVVLDTAGNLVFGESRGRSTPEWQELASLLKKHRYNCPINGIILAISAETLLSETDAEAEAKAGTIARHFDTLQSTLGVKFPVFIIVTKSDKIPGFSAFFEEINDPAAQQQIFGWSNPAPLEAPFRPEILEGNFHTISQRLRRRRLGVLLDPVPRLGSDRRSDEVDRLFDLPTSIQSLVPKLRHYTDNIFVAGEWSTKPLFLRGIYFTSAESQNEDALIAAAMSSAGSKPRAPISLDSGRSLFLRDVFLDKVFREDSLVTTAAVGLQSKSTKRMAWFGLGIVVLLALFALAINDYMLFRQALVPQLGYWDRATVGWEDDHVWFPIVAPDENNPALSVYRGNEKITSGLPADFQATEDYPEINLLEYLRSIADFSARPVHIPLLFQPFTITGTNPDTARLRAQRTLFNSSVVRPLADRARVKMAQPDPANTDLGLPDPRQSEAYLTTEAKALAELVRVECEIVARSDGQDFQTPGSNYIPILLEYTTGVKADPLLVDLMNWTYSANPYGDDRWAPEWMSGGDTLAKNTAIDAGIDRLIDYVQKNVNKLDTSLATIQVMADAATNYIALETELSKSASVKGDWSSTSPAVGNAFELLQAAKVRVEQSIGQVQAAGLFQDGPITLSSALSNVSSGAGSHLGQVEVIMREIDAVLPQAAPSPTPTPAAGSSPAATPTPTPPQPAATPLDNPKYRLLLEIKAKLAETANLIKTKIDGNVDQKLVANYQSLDAQMFDNFQGTPIYLWRWNAYEDCAASAPQFHFQPDMYLVDQRWAQLGNFLSAMDSIQSRVNQYTGPLAEPFLMTCSYLIDRGRSIQTGFFVTNYVQQSRDALMRVARFPLVWPPGPENEALDVNQLQGAKLLLNAINADLQVQTFTSLPVQTIQPVYDFVRLLAPLYGVVDALIKPDGSVTNVTVTLYNGQAQKQLSGPNFAPGPSPTPTPTPPPRSLMSKVFGGAPPEDPLPPATMVDTDNWNAIELLSPTGIGGAVIPLDSPGDVQLGAFQAQQSFSFRVYRSLLEADGTDMIDGGKNWSALRLIARLGSKPLGVGQDWPVALKPNEPIGVWVKFSFELPLPTTAWPTIDSLGLRAVPGQAPAPAAQPAASPAAAQ